ncbi:MAG: L-seryl-tRNA(Sec) selenium transferase [Fimbriimonas ginsengisoli]|uniref:L-seryl-tRNA(Sec) selenium transferase n=1 Tax=Fimbriimonas ginsengisoli TaxID=1005039 RepID=A0A931LTK2_FIMGI|nr:L-seryl-tRNA(Sec) selenium transferase [Fimbriimonas ginsengisoli]
MSALRRLPRVDTLAESPALADYPRPVRVSAARAAVERLRRGAREGVDPSGADAEGLAADEARRLVEPSLRSAINMSGVVLHTGLGRARLARAAVEQIALVAASHSAVELDPDTGRRGDRQTHVRDLLRELTGAEEAHVVNNAAAAVTLSLSALAAGREVNLSRGQMVEIGGSFRMPEIVEASGCRLIEVGCTNKTRLSDYERALTPETAAILRCHTSNYRMVGFVAQPTISELAELAHGHSLPLVMDLGSGCLVDTTRFGLPKEPTVQECVAGGADVVIASGDKLLGGPQAGLIVGRPDLIERIRKHPLARAVRVDKLTLAGLEATLRLYAEGREGEIPTLAALGKVVGPIRRVASRLRRAWKGQATVRPSVTEIGGGSMPGAGLPTFCLVIEGADPEGLARRLRLGRPAIVGRVQDGAVWLDPRTLDTSEVRPVEEALKRLSTAS